MLRIVAGCYEQMLLGYSVSKDEDVDRRLKAELSFTDHSHSGCVRTVASGSSYLASGSSDEAIFLFDMKENKEVGSLQGHEGTITHLLFPDENFLMSSSDDGSINIWRVSSKWTKLKSLHGHKGPVSSFDVHPSGKLALSASAKDGTLRTWNLITGRPVYVKNMKKYGPEIVKFSPNDGSRYLITSKQTVQVYELESAECIAEIKWKKSILAAEFITKDILIVTGEGNEIHIYDANGKCLTKFEAHTSRIKAVHRIVPPSSLIESDTDTLWLGSASSDGHIKIWSVDVGLLLNEEEILKAPKCILDIDTKARLTCLTSWKPIDDAKD